MRALGAVVLSRGVDAVTFLQLVFRHARHVVLDDLGRLLRALNPNGRRLGCQASATAVEGADAAISGFSWWFLIVRLKARRSKVRQRAARLQVDRKKFISTDRRRWCM